MLTPSPLKRLLADEPMDLDDDFFQSPPKTVSYVHRTRKDRGTRQSIGTASDDENEGNCGACSSPCAALLPATAPSWLGMVDVEEND